MYKLKRYDKAVVSTCPNFFSINFFVVVVFSFFNLAVLTFSVKSKFLQRNFYNVCLNICR